MRERTEAAVAWMNGPAQSYNDTKYRQGRMAAFLGVFHPDMDDDRRRELIRSVDQRD